MDKIIKFLVYNLFSLIPVCILLGINEWADLPGKYLGLAIAGILILGGLISLIVVLLKPDQTTAGTHTNANQAVARPPQPNVAAAPPEEPRPQRPKLTVKQSNHRAKLIAAMVTLAIGAFIIGLVVVALSAITNSDKLNRIMDTHPHFFSFFGDSDDEKGADSKDSKPKEPPPMEVFTTVLKPKAVEPVFQVKAGDEITVTTDGPLKFQVNERPWSASTGTIYTAKESGALKVKNPGDTDIKVELKKPKGKAKAVKKPREPTAGTEQSKTPAAEKADKAKPAGGTQLIPGKLRSFGNADPGKSVSIKCGIPVMVRITPPNATQTPFSTINPPGFTFNPTASGVLQMKSSETTTVWVTIR